jgi:hypothetical protein
MMEQWNYGFWDIGPNIVLTSLLNFAFVLVIEAFLSLIC